VNRRRRRIGVPIEKHAEDIYTRAMYDRFSDELYYSGSYTLQAGSRTEEYRLTHYRGVGKAEERTYTIKKEEPDMLVCSCGLYEHEGMVCRHALKVSTKNKATFIVATKVMNWNLTNCYCFCANHRSLSTRTKLKFHLGTFCSGGQRMLQSVKQRGGRRASSRKSNLMQTTSGRWL
jgi:hypothetical protein